MSNSEYYVDDIRWHQKIGALYDAPTPYIPRDPEPPLEEYYPHCLLDTTYEYRKRQRYMSRLNWTWQDIEEEKNDERDT
jgi:hypothetical protein